VPSGDVAQTADANDSGAASELASLVSSVRPRVFDNDGDVTALVAYPSSHRSVRDGRSNGNRWPHSAPILTLTASCQKPELAPIHRIRCLRSELPSARVRDVVAFSPRAFGVVKMLISPYEIKRTGMARAHQQR